MKNLNKFISGVLISSLLFTPVSTLALTKEETVYTNLNYDGTVEKTIVNNHISDLDKGKVTDDTELKKLLNINGKETYTENNGIITWNAKGKDIYYQGTTDKELPITVDAKYYLDGKEMKAKKLVGKKGKVTIKLSLKNNAYDTRTGLYTPFVVTVGTSLSNKTNSNITITNGKVTSTGNKSMVVALAAPGLYESLGTDELKGLDSVEISFDTTSFSLNNIYLISSPKLLSETDMNIFNKMDTLNTSLNTLQVNMDKAVAGANELKAGTQKISTGANTLSTKLEEAQAGIDKLEAGSVSLTSGIKEIIVKLTAAKQQLMDAQNNAETIEQMKQLQELQAANNKMIAKIKNGFGNDEAKINNAKQAAIDCNMETEENELTLGFCLFSKGVTLKQAQSLPYLILLENNNTAISTLTEKINSTVATVDSMLSQLEEALYEAETGSEQVTAGLTELKAGVAQLSAGAKQLSDGTVEVFNGTESLASGLDQLNKEGINKLSSNGKTVNNYSNKLKTLVRLSKNYNGYSSNSSSNSTFIYKMKSATK